MLINYKKGDRIVPSKYFLENTSQACVSQGIVQRAGRELIKAYRDGTPIFVGSCPKNSSYFQIKYASSNYDYLWSDECFDFYDFTNDTIKDISELSLSKAIDLI